MCVCICIHVYNTILFKVNKILKVFLLEKLDTISYAHVYSILKNFLLQFLIIGNPAYKHVESVAYTERL